MDLARRAARALRWAAGLTLIGQIATWAMTIVVIRLLAPSDYGLMALATMFISFLMIVNELGLGAALVQRRDVDDLLRQRVFGATLLANLCFALVLLLLAPLIASFFEEPRLTSIIRVLALQFMMCAFEVVPVASLERNLDLKGKSLCNLVAALAGGVVTLGLAWSGWGVWSLVYGNLSQVLVRVVGYNLAAPFLRWPRFDFWRIVDSVRFGGFVMLERAMWSLYSQADVLIVGKLLGAHILGIYAVAMHIASLIMHKTGGVLYEVAFPTFSRAQEQGGAFEQFLLKALRLLAVLCFPVFFGMASVAPELVSVLLGSQWSAAVPALVLLSAVMPIRMASNLLPPALQAVGRPDVSVLNLVVAIVAMPLAFVIGTFWGLVGVCAAWLVAFPLVWLTMLYLSASLIRIGPVRVIRVFMVPAACAGIMWVAVALVRGILEDVESTVLRLALLCGAGAVVYAVAMLLVARDRLHEVVAVARR
jgi:O-antigen/teichoic acid export membrane protein